MRKLKVCCLGVEEGKAAIGEGRKVGGALFEVNKADVFSKCCLAGTVVAARSVPASLSQGVLVVHPSAE